MRTDAPLEMLNVPDGIKEEAKRTRRYRFWQETRDLVFPKYEDNSLEANLTRFEEVHSRMKSMLTEQEMSELDREEAELEEWVRRNGSFRRTGAKKAKELDG